MAGDNGGAQDLSVPLRRCTRAKPFRFAVEDGAVDLGERDGKRSYLKPLFSASRSYIPTWAISGSV